MARAGTSPRKRSSRRRQRSVRVTLAISLLVLATVLVVVALPTRSVLWLSLASVSAMVLAWAALRMMWTEVLQSRRENAADRSAAAAAYRTLYTARVAEHAEFTTAMTERLAEAHLSRRELEGQVAQQESRVAEAEQRVQELESLIAGKPEDDDVAAFEAASRPRRPRLVKEA